MVTKAKKALLASLAAFLCVMLTVFGFSMSVSLSEKAKAADETTTEVAEVSGVKFATLAEAIAAAESGDTITLLADIANTDYTVANVINIKLAEGVTLDGNNHTLSGNVKITVASAGGVTIQNVKFKDIHNDKVIDSDSKTKYGFSDDKVGTLSAIYASNLNGSLTVMDCEFENVDWDAMQITPATGAEVVIKNNIFKVSESETVKEQLRHVHIEMAYGGGVDYEGTDISLTVADNQFFDKNVTSIGAWWIGKGSNLALSGNYYADPDSASITLSDKSFNRENRVDLIYPARSTADVDVDDLTATVMVIKDAFNSATYSTLAEAIAAAEDGQTIKLLADCSGNGIQIKSGRFADKGLTVDFGGHTYTVGGVLVGSASTGTNAFQLLQGNKITFQNGTIKGVSEGTKPAEDTPNWHGAPAIVIQNYCDLTLKNMTVSGGDETVYTMSNNNGDVVIEDTTINAGNAKGYTTSPFAFDVCRYDTYPSVSVTVRGNSVINGNIEISGAIGEGQNRQLNVENGTFKGTFNVLGNVPANIAISGGTFTNAVPAEYCANGFIPTQNADGTFGVKKGTYVAEVNGVKYETLQAAIGAAPRNAIVTLLANTKENVTIAKALTLDLNGYTINGGTEKGKPAVTVTARIVTIQDSSAAQTGTIKREDTVDNSGVSSHYVIDVQGNGWLIFKSGNVINHSGNDEGKGASLVRVGDDSVAKYPGLNIKGGTFTQDNFIVIKVDRGDLFLNGGTLNSANSYAIETWHRATVKNGTVNGAVSSWVYSGGLNSTLEISGGTINGDVESVTYDGAAGKLAKVSITGGTVTGTLSHSVYGQSGEADKAMATIEVSGGTFSADPTKYVVEDSAITKNADGTFGVEKAYLAKVGDTSYYTMDEAFKAQTASGEAIVLLRDYTTGSEFKSGTKHRVVDLNGHTWTYTGSDADCAAFEINYSNATLTVKNGKIISNSLVGLIPSAMSGTITYDNAGLVFEGVTMTSNGGSGIETNGNNTNDSVTLKNSTLNVPNGFGIYFPSSGTLTIDNSTINAKTMGVQVCSGMLNINAGSVITVEGDAVPKAENDGAIQDGAAISIVNRPGYKGLSNIVITGGKFTAKAGNDAIKAYDWVDKVESTFTKADLVAVSGGTFTKAVPAEYCADRFIPTQNEDGTYGVKEGTYVAKIGEVGYETLAEAIAAATDGRTVMLLTRVAENVVIDADKNFTLDLNGFTLNGGTGNKNAAILNNGTLVITDSSAAKTGTIKRDDNGDRGYYVILNHGTMTIEQANVVNNSGHDGSSLICNGDNDEVANLTINGGRFTQLNFIAIKNGVNGILVVNGGEITSHQSAIQNWYNATIKGGTIKGQLWTDAWTEGGSVGNTVIDGNVDYEGEIVMDVTGSSIKPTLTVNGGNLSVTNWRITTACAKLGGKPAVSGGTFSSEVNKDYLANGFVVNKNTDGTYGVTAGSGLAGAYVVVNESLAMKVVVGTASKYVVVTYKGLDGIAKTVRLDKFTDIRIEGKDYKYCLFDQIMPQMIDVKFSFELYGENDVMLDRKANYSVVDYLADIIASEKDSAEFRNVAASLIEYANKAMAVKGLTTTVAPTFVDKDGKTVTLDYNAFVAKNKIPAKDTLGEISEGSGKVIYKARVVFDDAYTLKFYTNAGDGYTYKLSKNGSTEDDITITFDENGEFTINVLAQDITTQYVIKVYGEDKTKPIQTVTYGVSTYCIRMQGTKTPQGELYVASYYYGVAVQQYGAPNTASVQG